MGWLRSWGFILGGGFKGRCQPLREVVCLFYCGFDPVLGFFGAHRLRPRCDGGAMSSMHPILWAAWNVWGESANHSDRVLYRDPISSRASRVQRCGFGICENNSSESPSRMIFWYWGLNRRAISVRVLHIEASSRRLVFLITVNSLSQN